MAKERTPKEHPRNFRRACKGKIADSPQYKEAVRTATIKKILPCFTRTWQAVSILPMSILLLLLLETMCVARLPRRTHKISLNYDNTKPDLFYNREFAATADRSQLGRWSERCGRHGDTSHTPYRHHSCFLDACMSKVRTWIGECRN
jgi:hypothetical protein